jgi:hypothetical protein
MTNHQSSPFDLAVWGSRLDLFTKLIASATGLSLVASFFFDWGFYSAFHLTFQDVPSGITDIIRTVLIWFPSRLLKFDDVCRPKLSKSVVAT